MRQGCTVHTCALLLTICIGKMPLLSERFDKLDVSCNIDSNIAHSLEMPSRKLHNVHMLLSYYQDITFNEQSQVPIGCISIWIKPILVVHVKVWYGKGESKCFFGRGGGGYWESLLYKSSTCFFSIPQHFSTSTLVGENTNRKRVLKYTTTYITYDDVSWEFSRRELKWHHMCLAQEGKFEIRNPE